jgi:hypothetical protein
MVRHTLRLLNLELVVTEITPPSLEWGGLVGWRKVLNSPKAWLIHPPNTGRFEIEIS